MKKKIKYIDLFSGIGGFHQAMNNIGGKCVFASEINEYSIETYKENYGINSAFDITEFDVDKIPIHDLLCAGFPCQAFSKAGSQNGFSDTRGTLFFNIEKILRFHKPKYILLENVRNLVSHDHGKTWKVIHDTLQDIGYRITEKPLILSPHQLGTPQLRERVFILGVYDPQNKQEHLNIDLGELKFKNDNNIFKADIIDSKKVEKKYYITENEIELLNIWDEFYKAIDLKIIGFPIWLDELKQNYNIDDLPEWKQSIIRRNRELYNRNKNEINEWLKKYDNLEKFTKTQRKFEWQAGLEIKSIWDGIIQFRPSGIRVKSPTNFPALVAMVQIPIIGKYKRRLTVREACRLQDFPETFKPHVNDQQAYKQLGNCVNVKVVEFLARKLLSEY